MPDRDTLFVLILILAASLALLAVTFVVWLQRNTAAGARSGPAPSRANAMPATAAASVSGGASWGSPPLVQESGSATPRAAASREDAQAERDGLIDPLTGLKTSLAWEEALQHEEARHGRYGRNATVVVAELAGLETLAERLGQEAADRLIPPVAATLQRGTRAADVVARVGHARFHILMPETDEITAINYVDRVRDATDLWLSAGAVAVRLALGWSSPKAGGSLADAVRVAEERMNTDRRPGLSPRAVRRVASSARDASA